MHTKIIYVPGLLHIVEFIEKDNTKTAGVYYNKYKIKEILIHKWGPIDLKINQIMYYPREWEYEYSLELLNKLLLDEF